MSGNGGSTKRKASENKNPSRSFHNFTSDKKVAKSTIPMINTFRLDKKLHFSQFYMQAINIYTLRHRSDCLLWLPCINLKKRDKKRDGEKRDGLVGLIYSYSASL